MAMCAGVQNVSRPIVRCHEMSQRMPMTMLVAPRITMRLTHETELDRPRASLAASGATVGMLKLCTARILGTIVAGSKQDRDRKGWLVLVLHPARALVIQ